MAKPNDAVNHPRHYTAHPSGVECITVVEHMGFNLGNAIKYIWRADEKGNAVEDLKKSRVVRQSRNRTSHQGGEQMMTLNELRDRAHAMAVEKGWYADGDRNIGELLMLVTTELAEAMEEFRHGRMAMTLEGDEQKPEGFGVEIADALIRLADMAGHLGLDLDALVRTKMEFNSRRPYRHGGKRA